MPPPYTAAADIRPRIAAIQAEYPDYHLAPEALAAAMAVWEPDGRVNASGVFEEVEEEVVARRGRAVAAVGVCRVRAGVYVHCCRLESARSGFAYAPSVWRADPHPSAAAARRAGVAELLDRLGAPGEPVSAETSALRMQLRALVGPADLTTGGNRATAGSRNPPPGGPMPRKKKSAPDSEPLPPAAGRVYRGRRGPGGAAVTVCDDGGAEHPLALRLDLRRHSPTGFGWGYAGSGPAQLALALAADALGDDDRAGAVHQRLKAVVVAELPADGWELTADQVRAVIRDIEHGRRHGHPTAGPRDHAVTPPPEGVASGVAEPTSEQEISTPAEPPAPLDPPNTGIEPSAGEPTHAAAHRPDGPRRPNPFGFRQDAAAGVRLLEDRKFKQMQLRFAEKPSAEVRELVRDAGYRWRDEEQAWTKQIDPEKGWQTRADADELFDRIAALIRVEKGITHEHA